MVGGRACSSRFRQSVLTRALFFFFFLDCTSRVPPARKGGTSSGRHLHMLNYGPVSRSADSSERTAAASKSFAAKSARGGSSADRSLGMALRQPMLLRALLVPACFAQASRTDSIDVLSPGGGCPTTTLRECSGHGQCDRTTRAHYDFCRCDRGYSGSACDRPDFLYACPFNCSYPRGVCSGVAGTNAPCTACANAP